MRIISLYDAAIRSICLAGRAFLDGDAPRGHHAVSQAQTILAALSRTFRTECGPVLGGELERLHGELMLALEGAQTSGNIADFDAVLGQVNGVREVWRETVERIAA